MTHNAMEILSQVFPMLSKGELTELASVAKLHSYPPGVTLCHEGHIEHVFYVMVSGKVEVTKQLDKDAQHLLTHLGPNDFFGEIALVQDGPRIASVSTVEPTSSLEVHRDAFMSVLQRSAPMATRIMLGISRRLRDGDQRSLTNLQTKNVELAEAYAELEAQQRLRVEFLTTVAHELRTPLTAATGYLHLINSGTVKPEQSPQLLATISSNLDTVVQLVNNILFLQEMELITPEFELLNVEEVTLRAIQRIWEQATQAGIAISTRIESRLPQLMGDVGGLSQAIDALLDNAIKFSLAGGEITVRLYADDGTLRIEIQDSGVGFPMERLDDAFKPFTRIKTTGEHLFRGVGLGLPIAKHIAELHGGHIEAKSQEGRGSTFTIVLPAAEQVTE